MIQWFPIIGYYCFFATILLVRWDSRGLLNKKSVVVYGTATVAFVSAVYETVEAAKHSPQLAAMLLPLVLLPGIFVAALVIWAVKRIAPLVYEWLSVLMSKRLKNR